jgi:hypothetical protein
MVKFKHHKKVNPALNTKHFQYYLDDLIAQGLGVMQDEILTKSSSAINKADRFEKHSHAAAGLFEADHPFTSTSVQSLPVINQQLS